MVSKRAAHTLRYSVLCKPFTSCTDARRTETCAAPRHVDASRDFGFDSLRTSNSGGKVGGGALFPCKVAFSGWQPIR